MCILSLGPLSGDVSSQFSAGDPTGSEDYRMISVEGTFSVESFMRNDFISEPMCWKLPK